MNHRFLAIAAGLAVAVAAQAQTAPLSPQAQYTADKKAAASRYASDKTLCNDETTSKARLDCRREAKAQYDSALAAAKSKLASSGAAPAPAPGPAVAAAPAVCADCGKVADVSMREEAGKGGPVGMIAGGVGGALLGRQIGSGTGRDVATVAGAVGGAYAGKKIEEKVTAKKVWTVTVDYPNNLKKSYQFDKDPGFRVGDPVKPSGSSIARR